MRLAREMLTPADMRRLEDLAMKRRLVHGPAFTTSRELKAAEVANSTREARMAALPVTRMRFTGFLTDRFVFVEVIARRVPNPGTGPAQWGVDSLTATGLDGAPVELTPAEAAKVLGRLP